MGLSDTDRVLVCVNVGDGVSTTDKLPEKIRKDDTLTVRVLECVAVAILLILKLTVWVAVGVRVAVEVVDRVEEGVLVVDVVCVEDIVIDLVKDRVRVRVRPRTGQLIIKAKQKMIRTVDHRDVVLPQMLQLFMCDFLC